MTVPPAPIGMPSKVHAIDTVRFPCSGSDAVPVNVISVPSEKIDPFAGAVIETDGGVLPPPPSGSVLVQAPRPRVPAVRISSLVS